MSRSALALAALLATALAAQSGDRGRAPRFAPTFADTPDRVWVAPSFFACRLQDWRIARGRIECVEGRPRYPVRALHVLAARVPSGDAPVHLRVRVGAMADDPDAFAGFLIGVGSEQIDYRTSALCHHRPAADGGMIVAVDGRGRIVLRDFARSGTGGGGGNQWSIAGPLADGELVPVAPDEHRGGACPRRRDATRRACC